MMKKIEEGERTKKNREGSEKSVATTQKKRNHLPCIGAKPTFCVFFFTSTPHMLFFDVVKTFEGLERATSVAVALPLQRI